MGSWRLGVTSDNASFWVGGKAVKLPGDGNFPEGTSLQEAFRYGAEWQDVLQKLELGEPFIFELESWVASLLILHCIDNGIRWDVEKELSPAGDTVVRFFGA